MSETHTGTLEVTTPAETPAPQPEPTIRCRNCGHTLTTRGAAIEVKGAHEHTFRNPAGYSFHVVCFSEAQGTLRTGTPTYADTWFPGYAWSFALCAECQTHVGWWYTGKDTFAGLIRTRLT